MSKRLGKILRLYIGEDEGGQVVYTATDNERNSLLTTGAQTTQSANNARGYYNKITLKAWSISSNFILNETQLVSLIGAMETGDSIYLEFGEETTTGGTTYTRFYRGIALISSITFAGQGNNVVQMNVQFVGDGALTVIG